jgi:hypothetical protein
MGHVDKINYNIFFLYTVHGAGIGRSVSIATGYGLDDRGVGVRVPVGSKIFLLRVVQTDSGAHPASSGIGTAGEATEARS